MERFIHEEVKAQEDIQVRFQVYRDSNHLVTSHWHNSLETVYVCQGAMDVTVNDRSLKLTEGEFVVINSADIHSTFCHEDCLVILLQIPYAFLKGAVPGYDGLRFEGEYGSEEPADREKSGRIRSLLLSMKEVWEKKPDGFALRFTSLVYEFLFTLVQCYKTGADMSLKVRTVKNLRRLESVMEFVKANYASPVSLEDAAQVLSLNPEYFCRFFKKYMGLTFLEYVNRVRLAHVYEDLLRTDLSVTAVLEKNGCANYKLFMRNFKSTYGCTPMQMRRFKKG